MAFNFIVNNLKKSSLNEDKADDLVEQKIQSKPKKEKAVPKEDDGTFFAVYSKDEGKSDFNEEGFEFENSKSQHKQKDPFDFTN